MPWHLSFNLSILVKNRMTVIQEIKNRFNKVQLPHWSIPVALIVFCFLSYGILVQSLGIYWDDWETILIIRQFPLSEFWLYFNDNRPLAAWTYLISSPFLGTHPLAWQLFTLLLRSLTVCLFWLVFCNVWPARKREVTFASFLFAIYPIFLQQYISVAYHQHWMAYLLFFGSLWLMIRAVQSPRFYWLFTILSILTLGMHLSILEYFVGTELLRPVILWILFSTALGENRKRIKKTFIHWLPYLAALSTFVSWRMMYTLGTVNDNNRPALIFDFVSQPLETIIKFFQMVLQDGIFILVSSWYKTLSPELIDLSQRFNLFTWGMAVLAAILVFLFLSKIETSHDNISPQHDHWIIQALFIGVAIILLGTMPAWVTYRQACASGQNIDRFGMVAMSGASLVFIALMDWAVKDKLPRRIFLCSLIILGVALQIRIANDYRWSWTRQKRLLWQLYWRAPAIEPHTIFLAENQLFPYVAPTFAFNVLYSQPEKSHELSYQFYQLNREFSVDAGNWLNGKELSESHREFTYTGMTTDALMLYFKTPQSNCLWLLNSDDKTNPYISQTTRSALSLSNFERIHFQNNNPSVPPIDILGSQPAPDWCYYYEKADLAQQFEEWEQVVELGNQARQAGYSPQSGSSNSPQEWLPFIEGYAVTGDWQKAQDLTIQALQTDKKYQNRLCVLWQKISFSHKENPEVAAILSELECHQYNEE
jgi:hypothetical protein